MTEDSSNNPMVERQMMYRGANGTFEMVADLEKEWVDITVYQDGSKSTSSLSISDADNLRQMLAIVVENHREFRDRHKR